ncbi:alpha/beta fold hydrolase [Actinomadura rubrisoli]|uniref:alpha/beta fold hydrolase n=1 Tax=Actinomadura rubrisoli TaxID=2530368 RepID=UPI001A9EEC09|nr:hypothetical protein [Actinomadura rubrisoli]
MTDEYDDGIIAKVTRAADLLEHLQAMQAELREGRQYARRDNARGDETNPIVWVEWAVTKATAPLPLAFSALLGDVINNLRAALDYSTWAAVDGGIRETNPEHCATTARGCRRARRSRSGPNRSGCPASSSPPSSSTAATTRAVPFETSLFLLSAIPESRLVVLNRCGHWAMIEHAAEFKPARHRLRPQRPSSRPVRAGFSMGRGVSRAAVTL